MKKKRKEKPMTEAEKILEKWEKSIERINKGEEPTYSEKLDYADDLLDMEK